MVPGSFFGLMGRVGEEPDDACDAPPGCHWHDGREELCRCGRDHADHQQDDGQYGAAGGACQ